MSRSARCRAGVVAGAVTLVAVLLMSGCSTSGDDDASRPDPVPPTATATSTPAGPGDSADVVPVADLLAITLPVPKVVPATGSWVDVPPSSSGGGDRLANFVDGNNYWMSVRFVDCNMPAVKRAAAGPADERGDFTHCFDTTTTKLGNFPLYAENNVRRVVKVGRLLVITGIGLTGQTKLKPADLEAFLTSLDLAAIAKL